MFLKLQLSPLSFRRAAVVIELVQVLCALKRSAMQLTISYVLDIRNVLSTQTRYEMYLEQSFPEFVKFITVRKL